MRPGKAVVRYLLHSLGLLWFSAYVASHCPGPALGFRTPADAALCYQLQGVCICRHSVCEA